MDDQILSIYDMILYEIVALLYDIVWYYLIWITDMYDVIWYYLIYTYIYIQLYICFKWMKQIFTWEILLEITRI